MTTITEKRAVAARQQREWQRAHPEHAKATRDAWRARNRDRLNEQQRIRVQKIDPAARSARLRIYALRNLHGMTVEDWDGMWAAQGGCCYLCGAELERGKKTHIDHDHSCCPTGRSCTCCRRGLSCTTCNSAIGMLGDDPDRVLTVARNLLVAQTAAAERIAIRDGVAWSP